MQLFTHIQSIVPKSILFVPQVALIGIYGALISIITSDLKNLGKSKEGFIVLESGMEKRSKVDKMLPSSTTLHAFAYFFIF